ncbi:hypothetical protein [Gemmata sp. SH-PL17]|uniref:hypothetical protein n=1 Tax=Gemmata sp. SH-PL17 TaxID=1630693 RepID=UPI0012F8447D|nr:hypothetical protein [Gemmata sp. SH-PL17]
MSDAKHGVDEVLAAQAGVAWHVGDKLHAGRLLFEAISMELRPQWASGLLDDLLRRSRVWHAALATATYVASHPEQWGKAHSVFSMIRNIVLELDRIQSKTDSQQRLLRLLTFGELVAKVTYNSTSPTDPFDAEAGWSIAACYKDVLNDVIGEYSSQLACNFLPTVKR